ncbi:MAG: sulfonate transport system substrate-binding protein [Sediminicola sp.]|jgi:ABC-type nitrate/sulfonate/bicarbonate transport system substrate-binding protein
MKTFQIGGVPEHFNLPWYLTLSAKEYTKEGVNLRWKDYPSGTGAMCKALRDKEIDMAVILTEGIVRDIIKGNECKIVQVFVKSPLIWGIHVAQSSNYKSIEDLKGTTAAISRYGSGSHLMAYVNAENQNWDISKDLGFQVIDNLDGAVQSLPHGEGDYFMWEKFMTKPHVDNGTFRKVGECPTPWPCFVIAVRNEVLEKDSEAIQKILDIINNTTISFKEIPTIDKIIKNRYGIKLDDVREWLSLTEWSQRQLSENEVENIQNQLLKLNLIKNKRHINNLLHNF